MLARADQQAESASVRTDLQAEIAGLRADLKALELAVSKCATKSDLREFELRMRLQVGAMLVIAAGLQITILGFLMALFTGVLP